MPTYEHKCMAEGCGHEWDAFYSIKADPPNTCPSCETEGQVKRLISGGSGKGIVILTGHEMAASVKSQGRKMAQEVARNENLRANLVGEEVYHQQQLNASKLENELVNIGKEAAPSTKKSDTGDKKVPQKSLNKGLIKRKTSQ